MKNLELINLLSLGNVVVAQPYENAEIKFKNFISKVESNILDEIQDEETKNSLIKEFGNSLDSLDSFTYKQFNYIFRARVFDSQDQKNEVFQKLRANSEIYKKFQEQKSKNSRRRKRSLFTEYQRLTIKDWIDRIQGAIGDNKVKSSENITLAGAVGGATIGAGAAIVAGLAAVPVVGWITLLIGGAGLALSIGGGASSIIFLTNSSNYWKNTDKITRKLDDLKEVFRLVLTSDNVGLEETLRQRIKNIIEEINQLSGNIIDFNKFDLEKILTSGY
ncbi:hypothetical protein [Mesomycoplasma dispar]|uniref:Glycine zipper family protein n=1 Tax=Mesomycoplasma dispar TaxID=86660 RepID=A0ABN5DZA5_9BACT|nr:hypothetical protein [Mesomycoplasma dispar]ATP59477.1 hypothetical protein CSW10_00680 [Mesomycoplasma dispar]